MGTTGSSISFGSSSSLCAQRPITNGGTDDIVQFSVPDAAIVSGVIHYAIYAFIAESVGEPPHDEAVQAFSGTVHFAAAAKQSTIVFTLVDAAATETPCLADNSVGAGMTVGWTGQDAGSNVFKLQISANSNIAPDTTTLTYTLINNSSAVATLL